MEAHQIDILAFAMPGNLEQIEDAEKSRRARLLWSDVRKPDRFNRIHLNLPFFHAIPAAHADARAHPNAHRAGDLSASNPVAKPFREHHVENLPQCVADLRAFFLMLCPWIKTMCAVFSPLRHEVFVAGGMGFLRRKRRSPDRPRIYRKEKCLSPDFSPWSQFPEDQTVRTAIERKRQRRDDILAWADRREAQVCGAQQRRTEGSI